jgi:sn-glycerol 3-phosphate transport system substrate-binding protein
MMKLKTLSTICLSGIIALSLAACGSDQATQEVSEKVETKNNTVETKNETVEKQELLEIDFWYSLPGASGEVVNALVDEYNASQDEIKVNATFQGDYYENHAKVMSSIAAGNQPDVTMVEIASIGAFADAGALEDLSKYGDDKDMNDFIPGLMGNSYWNDTLYALPFNRSTPILYLNKNMLEAAGLDATGPKTWDELQEYARALTKDDKIGFSTPVDIWFYEALVFENGGNILSEDGKKPLFNSDEAVEPVVLWQDMIKEGIMKLPPGEKYNAWEVANQDFTNGNVGMIFTSTGYLNYLMETAQGFEVATAFLPAKKEFGVPTGGTNLVMLAKTPDKEKEAAWKFMQWMTAKEQTIMFSKATGYMPVRDSAASSDEMKALYEEKPQFKVAVDQLEYAKPRPMVPGYKELQEVIMTEIQRAVIDESVSAEEALNNAAQKAEKLLK